MLLGTVVGVMVIPGLYYLFARLSDGRKLLREETGTPFSEQWETEPILPDDASEEEPSDDASSQETTHEK